MHNEIVKKSNIRITLVLDIPKNWMYGWCFATNISVTDFKKDLVKVFKSFCVNLAIDGGWSYQYSLLTRVNYTDGLIKSKTPIRCTLQKSTQDNHGEPWVSFEGNVQKINPGSDCRYLRTKVLETFRQSADSKRPLSHFIQPTVKKEKVK